ncbi:MAG: glycosyltransferase family 2 protein [Proteobacteria bacterium]|nr:glycosyltransferase family 2 protein [Pseudomonadota bacterium]MBU1686248.1 glycosyltransferase family 2 protein [Pseudomonadota bacterium]
MASYLSHDSGSRSSVVDEDFSGYTLAVLIPCYNEEGTVGKVVSEFRKALPMAEIFVYDNNSTDGTREAALAGGAVVRSEPLQGKGNVIRRMFSDIEADIYLIVDGDDTYHAPSAPLLVQRLLSDHLDMVNASRISQVKQAFRPGHRFGNILLSRIVAGIFGDRIKDMLSGYRVFSRRFVKSFPALSNEFEIETELTVHALELRMPIAEIETPYKERPAGSFSKLKTGRDGVRILKMIAAVVKEERPLPFFSLLFAILASVSVILAVPIFMEYHATGLVPRFPTAILSTGMMLLGFLCLGCGLILDTVTHGRREMKRMLYLFYGDTSSLQTNSRRIGS